jgi:hypothetical protein
VKRAVPAASDAPRCCILRGRFRCACARCPCLPPKGLVGAAGGAGHAAAAAVPSGVGQVRACGKHAALGSALYSAACLWPRGPPDTQLTQPCSAASHHTCAVVRHTRPQQALRRWARPHVCRCRGTARVPALPPGLLSCSACRSLRVSSEVTERCMSNLAHLMVTPSQLPTPAQDCLWLSCCCPSPRYHSLPGPLRCPKTFTIAGTPSHHIRPL